MTKYILWVTTKHGDGFGSKWYGWSRNLTFTQEKDAQEEKRKIQDKFYDVEVVEI